MGMQLDKTAGTTLIPERAVELTGGRVLRVTNTHGMHGHEGDVYVAEFFSTVAECHDTVLLAGSASKPTRSTTPMIPGTGAACQVLRSFAIVTDIKVLCRTSLSLTRASDLVEPDRKLFRIHALEKELQLAAAAQGGVASLAATNRHRLLQVCWHCVFPSVAWTADFSS